jgi:hypothetical protein
MALLLHEVLNDLHQDHPMFRSSSHVDDVVTLGWPELERQAYLDLVEMLWTRRDLISQLRKCIMYFPEGNVPASPPIMAGAYGCRQGAMVLGVPIGSDELVQQAIVRQMRKLGWVGPLLRFLRDLQM